MGMTEFPMHSMGMMIMMEFRMLRMKTTTGTEHLTLKIMTIMTLMTMEFLMTQMKMLTMMESLMTKIMTMTMTVYPTTPKKMERAAETMTMMMMMMLEISELTPLDLDMEQPGAASSLYSPLWFYLSAIESQKRFSTRRGK